MKKITALFTVLFIMLAFAVPAFAAGTGSEGNGKTAVYIVCVILLICAVVIYFKRKG